MRNRKPEKVEEKKFCRAVQALGYKTVKLATQGPYGRRGRNDQLVLAELGVTAFFEFKREGEEATEQQIYTHNELKELGHHTYVVYKADEALKKLARLIRAARVSRRIN